MTPDIEREKDSILVQVGTALDAAREAQRLTVADVARRAGLSKQGAIHVRKCQGDPRLSTLIALGRAVGLRCVVTLEPEDRS